jgi:hypothetical protein
MTNEEIVAFLDRVRSWPQEDQQELVECARDIETHRTGVYVLNEEERAAIEDAERSGVVPEEEMEAFRKSFGVL